MIEAAIEKRLGAFTLNAAFKAGPGVTALFGRSGSGKSTIVKALAGLIAPDNGTIRFGETLVFGPGINIAPQKRGVGVVFQEGRLFPHMTVSDNLLYGYRRALGPKNVEPEAVVDLLGLGEFLPRRPNSLSGGERQRVAVGRAILSQPRVLLMDEPLASIDQHRKREVLPFLGALAARFDIPILYVTHDVDEVLALASGIIVLGQGTVVADGSLNEVTGRLVLPAEAETLGSGAILTGEVASHDAARGLSLISTEAGMLTVPLLDRAAGGKLALRIAARDVALATAKPGAISIQNCLAVTVEEMAAVKPHIVRLSLNAGRARLIAEITQDARARLNLSPGSHAFALVKSVALSA